MYGMVNKAVEDMVCMHFDEATWEESRRRQASMWMYLSATRAILTG